MTAKELSDRFDAQLVRLEAAIQRVEALHLEQRTPEEQTKAIDEFIQKWRGEKFSALSDDE
jgi:hypothetical protein